MGRFVNLRIYKRNFVCCKKIYKTNRGFDIIVKVKKRMIIKRV